MSVESLPAISLVRSRSVQAILGLAVFAIAWFALLGIRPLYEPDEGRYAEIPREMLAGAGYVIPHLNGLAYLEKPPLQYWLTAAAMHTFGENEFAARLVTGLAGFASLLMVCSLAARLWGVRAAWRAGALLPGSSLFMLLSHQLTLDMLLTFWLVLALSCFIRAQIVREGPVASRRWMLGCWAGMAGAVMTKGLIGVLIPAATLLLYALLQRDFDIFRRLELRWGPLLFAVLVAPWFVLAAHGNKAFLEFFFVREHFERYLTTVEHRVQPWWFFLLVLGIGVLPWIGQALGVLWTDGRQRVPRGRFDPVRLLWVWCLFILVFFSLSESKLIPYILPAIPALALLCARHEPRAKERILLPGALLTALLAVILATMLVVATHGGHAHTAWATMEAFSRPLALLAAFLLGGAALSVWYWREGRSTQAMGTLCMGWCLGCSALLGGSGQGDPLFSGRALAQTLRQQAPPSASVFNVANYDQTLPFYLGRTVIPVAYRGELDFGLTQAPQLGIDTMEEFKTRWMQLEVAFAVMPSAQFAALSAESLPMRFIARSGNSILVARR